MKRKLIAIVTVFFFVHFLSAQSEIDSLKQQLRLAKNDSVRVNLLLNLSDDYGGNGNLDSQLSLANEALQTAQVTGYKRGELYAKSNLAIYWWYRGDYATSIKLYLQVLDFEKSQKDTSIGFDIYAYLINAYRDQGDYKEALSYCFLLMQIAQKDRQCSMCGMVSAMTGSVYYGMNDFDSAFIYLNKALIYPHNAMGWIFLMYGRVQAKLKNNTSAFAYYRKSIDTLSADSNNNKKDLAGAYISIGELYNETGDPDSAIYYGKRGLNIAKQDRFNKETWQSYLLLAKAYEKINPATAVDYYKLAMAANDTLYNQEKQREISSFKFNEQLHQQELQQKLSQSRLQYRNRLNIYILLGGLLLLLLVAGALWRRNIFKQRAYTLLQKQKEEIAVQKTKTETALQDLKATQAQLIQSEKMASLGELTAGIAHEIQNPLNFVNNFSDVNKELLTELNEEIENGNYDDAKAIAKDVIDNEEKINHHGKRADSIVKGMLQHSRASSGQKEPTDINKLADEYLRLSYHGFRAKDKGFNAEYKTDFDESIGKINLVPQDIGRVLLNLFNNAFYAVTEKKKTAGEDYQPTVSVTTKRVVSPLGDGGIEISVADNGNGIPQNIKDKIFQPFFTTKPTGQGTGLGLSLAYDIIKAHGGEIKVETKEGEGSEFNIYLSRNEH
jgi:signal transduction histidine kinase